jgi:hypothetical protein
MSRFVIIALALAAAATAGYSVISEDPTAGRSRLNAWIYGCKIKGNINITGARIYHVPGQAYYSSAMISARKGERWFCSEGEAVAAGWRRSQK